MTDFYYDSIPGDGGLRDRVAAATWINWAGAALSVSLMAGLGMWGVELLRRDVAGVPVVRAIEGPMRIAPDDPGGLQAAHQGLSVNAVAAEGALQDATELTLAPAPVTLSSEDRASGTLDGLSAAARRDDGADAEAPVRLAGTDLAVAEVLASLEDETTPIAASFTMPTDAAGKAGTLTASLGSAVDAAVGQALTRPAARPGAARRTAAAASAAPATPDMDPTAIAPGTRLVQLGAFGSAEVARSEWERTKAAFGPYLEGKSRVVTKAETGGRTFWRLRAHGFEDLADARRFCAVLVNGGENCIPVVKR